jgi:hypothetical protein
MLINIPYMEHMGMVNKWKLTVVKIVFLDIASLALGTHTETQIPSGSVFSAGSFPQRLEHHLYRIRWEYFTSGNAYIESYIYTYIYIWVSTPRLNLKGYIIYIYIYLHLYIQYEWKLKMLNMLILFWFGVTWTQTVHLFKKKVTSPPVRWLSGSCRRDVQGGLGRFFGKCVYDSTMTMW